MGIIKAGLIFAIGAVWGIYIAQNYSVPDVKGRVDEYFSKGKHIEETYRKSNNTTSSNDATTSN
ncbi:hypothetical protein RND81_01G188600 [Saponaria officinalis]|uniref:Uncharacterized protein n=1 Tax=Saponaria officinalis TaxID=3572 RepID=A0AAW1NFW1_SAPOF